MTWDAYRRRKSALQGVLAVADARTFITVPEAIAAVPGARDAFPHDTDLLFDLQLLWSTRLSTRLDVLVGDGADTPEIGVIQAWVDTAAVLPGTRRLLDAHRHEPALAKARAKEEALLARAAGVPAMSSELLERGREIKDAARHRAILPRITPAEPETPNLLTRLRNALAA